MANGVAAGSSRRGARHGDRAASWRCRVPFGEAAPLILLGGVSFITFNPDGPAEPLHHAADPHLQLDPASAGGVPRGRVRRHRRAPRRAARHELSSRSSCATSTRHGGDFSDDRYLDDRAARLRSGGRRRVAGVACGRDPRPCPDTGDPPVRPARRRRATRSSRSPTSACSTAPSRPSAASSMDIGRNQISALIGPSGCGKSTVLRCFNRTNDLVPGASHRWQDPLPRPGPVRRRGRPHRGAAADRHGVPEAQPVPQVDLRQHRVRPEGQRHEACPRAGSTRSSRRR